MAQSVLMRNRVGGIFRAARQGMVATQRVDYFATLHKAGARYGVGDNHAKSVANWLEIVRSKGQFIEMVSEDILTKEICEAAVHSDPLAIKHVPAQFLDEKMIVEAVSRNYKCFFMIPKNMRSENVYLALAHHFDFTMALTDHNLISKEACRFAVQFNSAQANHVPEKFKADIDAYLAGVKYLVVRQVRGNTNDEIKFSAISYARSEKRKSTSLCAYPSCVADTLQMLADKGASGLNLVFLSHLTLDGKPFAGFHADEIVALLEQYPIVDKVTLLGCKTIESLQLDQEAEMLRNLAKSETEAKCGLIILDALPGSDEYDALLAKTKLSRVFVMTNDSLLYLETSLSGDVTSKLTPLDHYTNKTILANLGPDKTYKFRKENEKMVVRSHMAPLSSTEFRMLDKLSVGADRFTKSHSQYQADKGKYPFLASISIDQAEKDKLQPSHAKNLIDAIERSDKIKRDVVVKGYPNRIYADQVNHANISTQDDVLLPGQFGFFVDRINRPLLTKMRRGFADKSPAPDANAKSQAKSIQYTVRKHN
jgi:hypothetical protein